MLVVIRWGNKERYIEQNEIDKAAQLVEKTSEIHNMMATLKQSGERV